MDRADQAGISVAVGGHILIFGALSLVLVAAPRSNIAPTMPVDIDLVAEVAREDTVRDPAMTTSMPAASAPVLGPTRAEPPAAAAASPRVATAIAPVPVPVPVLAPAAAPKVVRPEAMSAAPATKPTVAKPAGKPFPAKAAAPGLKLALRGQADAPPRGSRLGTNFLKGVSDKAAVAAAPRAAAGPVVAAGLAREVLRQLKPHWKAPTGADAEQLRTTLSIALNRDGSVASVRVLETSGQTPSNRGQVRLHQEAAIKAVRLAAPFVLPVELYDAWQVLEPVSFDKRLG